MHLFSSNMGSWVVGGRAGSCTGHRELPSQQAKALHLSRWIKIVLNFGPQITAATPVLHILYLPFSPNHFSFWCLHRRLGLATLGSACKLVHARSGLSRTAKSHPRWSHQQQQEAQTLFQSVSNHQALRLLLPFVNTDGKQKQIPIFHHWSNFLNPKKKRFFFFSGSFTNTSKLCHDYHSKSSGLFHFKLWKLNFLWPLKITGFGKGIQDTVWGSKTLSCYTPRTPNYNSSAVGERVSVICAAWVTVLITNWGDQLHVKLNSLFPTSLLQEIQSIHLNKPSPSLHFRKDGHFKFCELFWAQSRCKKF